MIIALSGKMGSGKTTTYDLLKDRLGAKLVLCKFAQPLYDAQNYLYKEFGFGHPETKDRKLLQWLGTDWARSKDDQVFVKIWKQKAQAFSNSGFVVVCDDCRFLNEAEAVRSIGGKIVKINKKHGNSAESESGTNHASEMEIDQIKGDYIFDNDTIDNLRRDVTHLVIDLFSPEKRNDV